MVSLYSRLASRSQQVLLRWLSSAGMTGTRQPLSMPCYRSYFLFVPQLVDTLSVCTEAVKTWAFPWDVVVRYPIALVPLTALTSPPYLQESPRLQISFFCSSHCCDEGPHDSVARSIEKCVIEAVSSVCQVTSLSCMGLQGFLIWPANGCLSLLVLRPHGVRSPSFVSRAICTLRSGVLIQLLEK